MPYLGSNALTLIQDIGVAFLPYIFLLVATFAAGMWAWAQQRTGKVTWQQVKAEAASEAVAAAEQAVAQANKDGKFQFARALLEAKVGKLDYAEVVSLIESAVARMRAQSTTQTVSATATSNSAQPILDKLARPTTAQRISAEDTAILHAIRSDMLAVRSDMATALLAVRTTADEAKARAIAAEQAIRAPQAPAGTSVGTGKKVVATPAAQPAPDPAASSAAPAQP